MKLEEMKARRKELGYSYERLSELSGVPLGTIQKIFGGMTKAPRYRTLRALEAVLRPDPQEYGNGPETDPHRNALSPSARQADRVRETSAPYGVKSSDDAVPPKKKQGEYTVEDYLAWPEDQRIELIDGVIYDMAAPRVTHQVILMEILYQLETCARNHPECLVLPAPTDVQLDRDNRTMVQPDILILCAEETSEYGGRLTRERIFGAPDFALEILSPSTRSKDMVLKLQKYQHAGVREYWIVDPEKREVITYHFGSGPDDIDMDMYDFTQKVPVEISGGTCAVDFAGIAAVLDRIPE